MPVTISSIYKDLDRFQQKFGFLFIRALCASLIKAHYDMNWNEIKSGIVHDPESTELELLLDIKKLKTNN
jgi:hypothetical protein